MKSLLFYILLLTQQQPDVDDTYIVRYKQYDYQGWTILETKQEFLKHRRFLNCIKEDFSDTNCEKCWNKYYTHDTK